MSNHPPASSRSRSRFAAIDASLNRFWSRVGKVVFLVLLGLVAFKVVVDIIEHITASAHAAVARHGLPICLLVLGAVAALAVATWCLRQNIARLVESLLVKILNLLRLFCIGLAVIIHYSCFVSLFLLIPIFCFLFLSALDASITSFLTAPIGIKDGASTDSYPIWLTIIVTLIAWAGYKSTKGIKQHWQAHAPTRPVDVSVSEPQAE